MRAFRVGLEIHAVDAPPLPRCWFLNEAHTELIQVQQDRFIHSWRKQATGDEYPRYEQIRETFRQEVDLFTRFLAEERLGELVPNQCEITYVDEIPLGEGWDHFGHLDRVLTVWTGAHNGSFLPDPEDVALRVRYIMPDASGEPIGRLHVTAAPAIRRADQRPILLVNVTARGRPDGEGVGGALRFLDIGHKWAVQGFVALTTPELHTRWGMQG